MNTIAKILLPVALLFACDTDDMEDAAESNEVAAADAASENQGRRGRGGPMRLDSDKDGAISLAEAEGHPIADKFAALDADRDGKLSREELRAMKGRRGERGGKDPAERAARFMSKFDADKDGTLSAAEVAERPWLAEKFAELDRDRDGKLAVAELQAMKRGGHGKRFDGDPAERAARFMKKLDADGDGSISAAESASHPRLAEKFAALDTDRDGKLGVDELKPMKRGGHHGKKFSGDPAERAAHVMAKFDADSDGALSTADVAGHPMLAGKFAAIDANGDGSLSMAELTAFKPAPRGERGERPVRDRATDRG